eukprot:CAMPEP_0197526054 /NCGR_PEP_ID=MMETSP1318-20131121/16098_1 /TAXON_ID=552666 /ORGANISM="Partenskyella glossopodia, Strain RCC365" /LENGTH=296 /DNA_ID=CAMNT_0043080007 /DNA_START=218 /DNA_END=1108 /DNA_ORIENTATION=+
MALFIVWWNQDFLLYQPTYASSHEEGRQTPFNIKGFRTPTEMHLPFEDVYLETEDGHTINGWLITQRNSTQCPCILYLHGNAGNIGHRLHGLRELYFAVKCNIFILDYRGYGNSSGSPSETGLILDAKAALKYVTERAPVDSENILVFGRSLGGAVAIALAEKHQEKIRGLIVENTFTCIDEMATVIFSRIVKMSVEQANKYIKPLLYCYLTSPWRSYKRIGSIQIPILFYSGLKDQLIPPAQMQELYSAANKAVIKWMHTVEDGDHNNTVEKGGEGYFTKFCEFRTKVVGPFEHK